MLIGEVEKKKNKRMSMRDGPKEPQKGVRETEKKKRMKGEVHLSKLTPVAGTKGSSDGDDLA